MQLMIRAVLLDVGGTLWHEHFPMVDQTWWLAAVSELVSPWADLKAPARYLFPK